MIAFNPRWWFIAGVACVVLEMLLPGFYLLWLGVAAGMTALFSAYFDIQSPTIQVIMSLAFGTVLIVLAKRHQTLLMGKQPSVRLNNKQHHLVGQRVRTPADFSVTNPYVWVGDARWMVSSDHAAAVPGNQIVEITAAQDGVLAIKKIDVNAARQAAPPSV